MDRLNPGVRHAIDCLVTVASVLLCALILPARFSGIELLGTGPNWCLIWVVAWSLKRTPLQSGLAGLCLGFVQDGLSMAQPSHALGLALAGVLTARLQKQRYIQEDFISVAMIVFAMAVVVETTMAIQFSLQYLVAAAPKSYPLLTRTWLYHQQIALSSAILSSLWAPVIYYPLNRWWRLAQATE
ncbi:MAG: rod shape-determining protein MreD [Cyanobacteria bacterium P01_A01_bin.135]